MRKTIVISGITGFLGSHIAEKLSKEFNIIGLIRSKSNKWRLDEINISSIVLINIEEMGFENKLAQVLPYCFIHCGWDGVASNDRDDWSIQSNNFNLTVNLLIKLKESGIKKFISLGSQAEYGYFDTIISERSICNPLSAYGATKLASNNFCKAYCQQNDIIWYWLRLFPIFGIREDKNWFIPMIIEKGLNKNPIELTPCEQKYAYLHISDFVELINKMINDKNNLSGVYNVSNNKAIRIKDIIDIISKNLNINNIYQIGKLPYRKNQVMLLQGNSKKLFSSFNFKPKKKFEEAILELIEYYKSNKNV